MKLVNVTPHPLRIRLNAANKEATPDPTDLILEPSGIMARVSVQSAVAREIDGIPVMASVFGDPVGLPEPEEGVIYVGSLPLAQRAAQLGRNDVVSPNTAPKQDIRDADGRTFAVFGFQQF